MAAVRISRVTARSNTPSSVRISAARVQQGGTASLASSVRIADVRVVNVPQGDVWVMSGGVWFAATLHVLTSGGWATYTPSYGGTY